MLATAEAYLAKKGLLDALSERQAALAETLLSVGEGPEPGPLPIGFGEKPKQAAIEAELEKKATEAEREKKTDEAKQEEKAAIQ